MAHGRLALVQCLAHPADVAFPLGEQLEDLQAGRVAGLLQEDGRRRARLERWESSFFALGLVTPASAGLVVAASGSPWADRSGAAPCRRGRAPRRRRGSGVGTMRLGSVGPRVETPEASEYQSLSYKEEPDTMKLDRR